MTPPRDSDARSRELEAVCPPLTGVVLTTRDPEGSGNNRKTPPREPGA